MMRLITVLMMVGLFVDASLVDAQEDSLKMNIYRTVVKSSDDEMSINIDLGIHDVKGSNILNVGIKSASITLNGIEYPAIVGDKNNQLKIVLIIDASGSMRSLRDVVIANISNLIDRFPDGTQFAIMFAIDPGNKDKIEWDLGFTDKKTEIKEFMANRYDPKENSFACFSYSLYDGFQKIINTNTDELQPIIMFVGDSYDDGFLNIKCTDFDQYSMRDITIRNNGVNIPMVIIGICQNAACDNLSGMARNITSNNVGFIVESFYGDLDSTMSQVGDILAGNTYIRIGNLPCSTSNMTLNVKTSSDIILSKNISLKYIGCSKLMASVDIDDFRKVNDIYSAQINISTEPFTVVNEIGVEIYGPRNTLVLSDILIPVMDEEMNISPILYSFSGDGFTESGRYDMNIYAKSINNRRFVRNDSRGDEKYLVGRHMFNHTVPSMKRVSLPIIPVWLSYSSVSQSNSFQYYWLYIAIILVIFWGIWRVKNRKRDEKPKNMYYPPEDE